MIGGWNELAITEQTGGSSSVNQENTIMGMLSCSIENDGETDMKQYVVKIETTSEIIWCRNCPMSICERKVIKTKVAGKLFARKEEVLVFT